MLLSRAWGHPAHKFTKAPTEPTGRFYARRFSIKGTTIGSAHARKDGRYRRVMFLVASNLGEFISYAASNPAVGRFYGDRLKQGKQGKQLAVEQR